MSQAKMVDLRKQQSAQRAPEESIKVSGFAPWPQPQLEEQHRKSRLTMDSTNMQCRNSIEGQHKEQLLRHFLQVQKEEIEFKEEQNVKFESDLEQEKKVMELNEHMHRLEEEITGLLVSNKTCTNEKHLMEDQLKQERNRFKEVMATFQQQISLKHEQQIKHKAQIEKLQSEFLQM